MNDIVEAVDFIRRERVSANAGMISSFDDDPEKAAEAVRLGKDTGVAPVLVNNDLDGFKRQQKVHLVTNLVENNPYLRDFVANDPMAPKVAHDDIGNLDNLTMNVLKTYGPSLVHPLYAGQKIGSGVARLINKGPLPWERGFMQTFLQQNPELVGEFLEGASHGTPEILRQQMLAGSKGLKDLSKLSPEEYKRQNESFFEIGGPLDFLSWLGESAGSAVGSAAVPIAFGGIGTVAGIPGGPPGMAAGAFLGASSTSYIMNFGEVYQALKRAGVDPVVAQQYSSAAAAVMTGLDVTGIGFVANRFMKAAAKKEIVDGLLKRIGKEAGLGAVVEGTTEGIQEIVKDVAVGIAADKGIMTKENAKGWVESALQGAVGGAAMTGGAAFAGGATPTQKAKPWIDAGKEPPAGIHPALDKLKEGQAQNDMERIDGLLKDAQATNLRERSPEMVAELLRRQLGDTAIEIPAQAVFELYGDKPVTAEDGLLGWIKDLESQMRSEYPGGGYISVPIRDWLAHVDPEVAKVLHDHILTRPTGVTIAEGKLKAPEIGPDPTEVVQDPQIAEAITADPAVAQIVEQNGQVIATTRQASSLGVITDLGPQAEYMLFQNRLQQQALLDRLNQAKTPEEIASLRQEVKEGVQTLRQVGKEAIRRVEPGWTGTPATARTTITFGKVASEVQPIFTDTLGQVLSEADIAPVIPFGVHLKPVIDRINQLAANVPVHVVSDKDFNLIVEEGEAHPRTAAFYSWNKTPGLDHIVIPESGFYGKNIAKNLFHEAIHAATAHALDNNPALAKAVDMFMVALKQTNPELETTYGFTDAFEFVAETMSNRDFQEALAAIELDENMARVLGLAEWKGKTLWQGIVEFIRRALAIPEGSFSALEGALRLTELATEKQAEVLIRREGRTVAARGPKQLELPVTRQEDLKIFEEARLVGLNAKQYVTMIQNIAERNALDAEFLLKKVNEFVKKKLTKEWKENMIRVKSEVTEAIENRPDIALMTFFRTGRLYGEQYGIPKMDPAQLTPEQRKQIPNRWQSTRGTSPMDFANLVGYTSVDQMAIRAALLEEQMIAAKQPSLRKHVDGLIKAETERRMMKDYGNLSENILAEVQDHVVSPIQMDLLHEDTVAMGMANGWTMPFTKAEVIKGVKATFGQLRAVKVSAEKFLRDAGKAGKLSGIASEIDKNPTEFFKQRQNQEYALRKANEAKVLEKELASFERTADKLNRREARAVDQTYFNYAQDMLEKAGLPVKNSRVEIDRSIAYQGHASLDAFIAHEKGGGVDLDLYIPEAYAPKQFEEMTVDEFREFKEVVDTLDLAGRIRNKLTIEGEQRDMQAYEDEVISNFEQMPLRKETKSPKGFWLWRIDAVWTRMEEIVKDLDLREELGPLWKGLIHPFELSKSKKFSMTEALSKKMKELKGGNKVWQRSLEDEIPHDFVYDSRNEIMFKLTRWNLIKMMLNVGNESNKAKLARGIASAYVGRVANGQETEIIMDRIDALIDKHANKEDWEFAQNIWDIFQGFAEEGDKVVRATMGKVPKWIEATPITNRHGTFAGGYVPLVRDKIRPIEGQKEMPDVDVDALMGPDFYRVATSRPHHLERTGAVYFVDITNGIENLAGRMQQHIHDIAYREFVMDAGKIIYNKRIMNAITKRYGVEYADQFEPWLRRIANEFTIPEKELGVLNDMLRFFRLNLTVAALPLNYTVMYSPSVGTMNVRQLLALGAETQENRKKILANSEELKHVLYTIDRDLTEQLQNVVGGRGPWAKYTAFQRRAVETMYKPLVAMEQETRSVTFYGEFMAQKAKGLTDEQAAAQADSVVRERHGAVSPGDLPAMMASNSEFVKLATVFMGYFSMIRNWTRQLPGQYRRGEYAEMAKTVWGTVIVAALFNAALFTRRKESDTVWSFLARAILDTPMSMVPYVREGWAHFTEARKPVSPTFSAFLATSNLLKDGWNALQGKEVKHPVRHTLNFMGQAVGIPATIQVGRTGEFLTDVARGKQRPKDFNEWIRGLHTGEAKLRK